MLTPNTALLSLHPRHANKIISGEKRLEFRRIWAKFPVKTIVIYATVPIQRIVAVADVREVHVGSPTRLWERAQAIGGGLSRRELYSYFRGRRTGYAIELENVRECKPALDPSIFIENFRPPQSFQYLHQAQSDSILHASSSYGSGRVIFVAGVHGAGKSTLCESLVENERMIHLSAGQIIRDADGRALSDDTKAVRDINYAQRLLVEGVKRIRRRRRDLLLDGHFALINGAGDVEAIGLEVFQALAPDRIVLVESSPQEIRKRLLARDKSSLPISKIAELQKVEVETAEAVAKVLAVPLIRIGSGYTISHEKACE